eukprot:8443674-Pyramimonas_sp.AAC.1
MKEFDQQQWQQCILQGFDTLRWQRHQLDLFAGGQGHLRSCYHINLDRPPIHLLPHQVDAQLSQELKDQGM